MVFFYLSFYLIKGIPRDEIPTGQLVGWLPRAASSEALQGVSALPPFSRGTRCSGFDNMDEMTLSCAGPAAKKNYVSIKETAPCKEKILAGTGTAQQGACVEERLLLIKTAGERSAILPGPDGGSGRRRTAGRPGGHGKSRPPAARAKSARQVGTRKAASCSTGLAVYNQKHRE